MSAYDRNKKIAEKLGMSISDVGDVIRAYKIEVKKEIEYFGMANILGIVSVRLKKVKQREIITPTGHKGKTKPYKIDLKPGNWLKEQAKTIKDF